MMTNPTNRHTRELVIGADHPALEGHFPGNPVVPGVVLLDCVLEAAEDWLGQPLEVATLTQAKFLAPLLPGERASMDLTLDGETLAFKITRGETLLAQGSFALTEQVPA
jgi:3-hydroxyacyl-[acyl-carrier-protein] dehydratase